MMRTRRPTHLFVALIIAGCGGQDMADLERLVEAAAHSTAHDASVPGNDQAIGFQYRAMTERSPFEPFAESQETRASRGPDPARRRHPQELFPLGQLEMVGTLAGRGSVLALIRDPIGTTHPLAAGDYLGRDHGRITKVRDSGVDILELVEDRRGGWTTRPRTLELSVPHPSNDGPAEDHGNGGIEE